MRLRQLNTLLDGMPPWAQFALAGFLVLYAVVSIYGRINTKFGAKVFSKIPEREIRTNVSHIVSYTIVPVVVCIGYLVLLASKWAAQ